MQQIAIGDITYRVSVSERDGMWFASALRVDTGDRFGVECAGASEGEAIARLTSWLEWQREHAEALDALQQAERAYHRTIAGTAFANPTEGPSALEIQRESLEAVEAARTRLDEVRLRKPE